MKETFKLWNEAVSFDGEVPLLHRYSPENKRGDGAVIIFAGGAYSYRAPHEGESYALRLNKMGIEAFVVDYRVAPCRYPAPILDAFKAISTVRQKAKEYHVDPNKIAVMGSSAGGHLAALSATLHSEDIADSIPNAQILCYPVTDIESHEGSYENLLGDNIADRKSVTPTLLANEKTPPAFIWHTSSDQAVDVKGSYRYAARLSELGVPVEMHIYPIGGHGLGLANGLYGKVTEEYVQRWPEELERWLRLIGWINQ